MTARKTKSSKAKPTTKSGTASKAAKAPSATGVRRTHVPAPEPKVAPPRATPGGVPTAAEREDRAATAPGAPALKKQELFKKVSDRSGAKKNQVKPIVEAAMEIIGEALGQGREVNLPPLGKIKQNRVKDNPNARVIIAKIRQPKDQAKSLKDTVADAAE